MAISTKAKSEERVSLSEVIFILMSCVVCSEDMNLTYCKSLNESMSKQVQSNK